MDERNKACREGNVNELSWTIGPSPKEMLASEGSRTASPDQRGEASSHHARTYQ